MTVTKVVDEDKRERRQKRIMAVLFSVCIFGFSYLLYDYFNIVNRTSLPEDLSAVSQTINGWKSNGLVTSFDPSQDKIVVREDRWDTLSKREKIGIVTQLARYCAEENKSVPWKVRVIGNQTSSVVGELGERGLVIL
jgi:hypothetical protein